MPPFWTQGYCCTMLRNFGCYSKFVEIVVYYIDDSNYHVQNDVEEIIYFIKIIMTTSFYFHNVMLISVMNVRFNFQLTGSCRRWSWQRVRRFEVRFESCWGGRKPFYLEWKVFKIVLLKAKKNIKFKTTGKMDLVIISYLWPPVWQAM